MRQSAPAARPGTPLTTRLLARVEKGPRCWDWTGYVHPATGYGMFTIKAEGTYTAHRLMYELHVQPIPSGHELDHLCRNRRCVRPTHLEPVTRHENIMRGDGPSATRARARRRAENHTHCLHGHELAVVGIYANGACGQCGRDRATRIRLKNREER